MKCFICEKEFRNKQALGGHISAAHPGHRKFGKRRQYFIVKEIQVKLCHRCGYIRQYYDVLPVESCRICGKPLEDGMLRITEEII